MALSQKDAERIANALDREGFDPSVTEEMVPTGRFSIVVELEKEQTADDVERVVQNVHVDTPSVVQPDDCPEAVHIS